MNKNYRYNRSTKNFQKGGSKLTKYQGEISQTGPENPKLSQALAGTIGTVLGTIGTALNMPSKEQRIEKRLGRTRKNLKEATPGTGRFTRLKDRELKLNKKSMASAKRGGTYKSGGTKRRRK